mgnify:CR=1 FL=1
MVFETVLQADLQRAVQVVQLRGNLFSADNGGNKITVDILDGGEPATVSGTVSGYVIRDDNKTVVIEGSMSGNKASITLPSSAYAVIGPVSIVIKVGTTTVAACTSFVYQTTTDVIVDPGEVIPSIAELLAMIAACEEATANANAAAAAAGTAAENVATIVAPAFDQATANDPDTYVTKDGKMYYLPDGHTAGTTWANTTKTETKVGSEISNLKSAIGTVPTGKTVEGQITELQDGKADAISVSVENTDPVLTIPDGANGVPMGMVLKLEPIQDLHGYEYPWPGGAGKNLANTANVTNQQISTNGTLVNNDYYRVLYIASLPAGTYTYSTDCPDCYMLREMYMIGAEKSVIDFKENVQSITFELSSDVTDFYICFRNKTTTELPANIKYQLEKGSMATTWEPYSNNSPISGHTGCDVVDTGKNLFDKSSVMDGYVLDTITGEPVTSSWFYVSDYIPVSANQTVFIPASGTKRRWFYDSKKTPKEYLNNSADQAYTPTEDGYIRVSVSNDIDKSSYQIEYSSSATQYEPFGQTYSITFTDSQGNPLTVYGGELTINKDGTGMLTEERATKTFNGTVDTWSYSASGDNRRVYTTALASDIKASSECISNYLKYDSSSSSYPSAGCIYVNNIGTIIIGVDRTITSSTDWNTFLASNNLQVVYELATPVTYDLTAAQVGQILSLLGINNLWSNEAETTVIRLEYTADTKQYIDQLFASIVNATGVSF